MRSPSLHSSILGPRHDEQALPPGTGMLLMGAASLVLWAVIAGIAVIV